MVPERIARRVAAQELDAYEHALTGVYGVEERERAEREGLMGISELLVETRKGWQVTDLCTGEKYVRPFARHR
jgi:hypothetical protein